MEHISSDRFAALILCAGFGTRLAASIKCNPEFNSLLGTPKPLLPLAGCTLLDRWMLEFERAGSFDRIVIITNLAHHERYQEWLQAHEYPKVELICTGATSNENRRGAIADILTGLQELGMEGGQSEVSPYSAVVVVAGDTLLPKTNLRDELACFVGLSKLRDTLVAAFGYVLKDPADCVNHGMISSVRDDKFLDTDVERITGVDEKPKLETCSSAIASAAVYFFSVDVVRYMVSERTQRPSLADRDALGFLIDYLARIMFVILLRANSRIDIGTVPHYRDALSFYQQDVEEGNFVRMRNEPAVARAYPRIGLLGNPSDGYGGQTISFAVSNLGFAEVVAYVPPYPSDSFSVIHNPKFEHPTDFSSVTSMTAYFETHNLDFGAKKLVIAGVVLFRRLVEKQAEILKMVRKMDTIGCHLAYSTSIPAMRGLAGSSALIWATVQALCIFYKVSPEKLCPFLEWPSHLRSIEQNFLGITCGLQDRVIQVYLGALYMDFRPRIPQYCDISEHVRHLPSVFVAYNIKTRGECSGKVHRDIHRRWIEGDDAVKDGMARIGRIAERGRKLLIEAECVKN